MLLLISVPPVDPSARHCVRFLDQTIHVDVWRVHPHMWGFMGVDVGIVQSGCQGMQRHAGLTGEGHVDAGTGYACAGRDHMELCCPLDRRPARGDLEFTVDALGMRANRPLITQWRRAPPMAKNPAQNDKLWVE
jgi:hypothetical protein